MKTSINHTVQIFSQNQSSSLKPSITPNLAEPFASGRAAPRLLFDFAVMASLFKLSVTNLPFLDFGAGTAWVSEFCCRMGYQVVSFDISGDLQVCLEERVQADYRINESLLSFAHGDGHAMPFDPSVFGHLLCYDTLHHMHDYPTVFSEFFRVLVPSGRGIFVEPGAAHSSSAETIAFLEIKKDDPTWIERDVILDEIDQVARDAGFNAGLQIVPMPHPLALQTYSNCDWKQFRDGDVLQRLRLTDQLSHLNYYDRVIFYVEKPQVYIARDFPDGSGPHHQEEPDVS